MRASLFFYNAKGIEPRIRTKMLDMLFGKMQKSNYAQYKYEIKGVLSKDVYIRPVRAVLIVKKEYTQEVIDIFGLYGIKFRFFEIILRSDEFKKYPFF
jgi:hypothetical protein